MNTLDTIALATGTDKSSAGHGYTAVYAPLLDHLRERFNVRLLEIGVWEGASLAMWSEWLPDATIVGVDVDLSRYVSAGCKRVHVREGNASDAAFIAALTAEFGPFDVVIDDGSHLLPDHVAAFTALWPHVRQDGYYIVEDLHTYWWERANAPGSESWLMELARDAMGRGAQRWEREERNLPAIDSVTFAQSLAIIRRA
jgi:trans-aconitate methyltransferase